MVLVFSMVAAGAIVGLLVLAVWLERDVLSPRAVIAAAARSKVDPDITEQVVAAEAARLLDLEAPPPVA
jgi:sensor c-di-GMP phosphodiesterase-like protein